ncbi:hypothetical protein MTX23_12570 [Bradyrhizobium sp. ISRA436]|uniref:hypothetical protein n=1 Tax=Bradyrhizobium sp. ISRA436 TaxID=2866195 RepID=UPI002479C2FD|nr:hypothetical protein [Bradyrhizobium sp. ISRA436]WGS01594.1 hypothetical protein MTX23_12570 [Bradyrhizobium sp. ISRA436]
MTTAKPPARYGAMGGRACGRLCSTELHHQWGHDRWSRREVWRNLFEALRGLSPDDDFQAIDSTTAKAHRAAAGGKGGRRLRPSVVPAVAGPPRSTPSATVSDAPSRSK